MSTRSSWYYDGVVHIWHDVIDGRCYVTFNDDDSVHRLWDWAASCLTRVMRLTGREGRFEAEHKAMCAQLNWARRDAIRTAIRDIEREGMDPQWAHHAIASLRKTDKRWADWP